MKKCLIFIFMTVCIWGISGCSSQDASVNASDPVSHSVQNTSEQEENWIEEDIILMFSKVKETDWEYIDCELMPDHASDRIGAVLFWDAQSGTSNVAFFDADGFYQLSGVYEKMSDQPDFTYLGDGAVTFKLETEDGTIYHYTLTISIYDSDVYFKAEADLPIQQ